MIEQLAGELSLVLAEAGPNNAPPNNPEWGKAAPTGLFVLLVFVVVCFFLFRSMNRHIKKVPTTFRAGGAVAATDATAGGDEPLQAATDDAPAAVAAPASASASAGSATATVAEPVATTASTSATGTTQTRPRLGTPEEMLAEQRAKRRAKLRKAKARARRDQS